MRLAVLALVCMLLLSGCGDAAVTETSTPTPDASPPPTETPEGSPTQESSPTDTETPVPTVERTAIDTPAPVTSTPSPTPITTSSPTSSATPPTPTATTASTPTDSRTPTPTPTATQSDSTGREQRSSWTVEVISVIDGDTMDVRMPDGSRDRIRLLGVDTPETSASRTEPNEWESIPDNSDGRAWLESWGQEATDYAETRLGGEEIYIETDPESDRRGTYDRLLVYAFQSETADRSFNRRLLDNGYARMYDTRFEKRSEYRAAEGKSQNDDIGVWGYSDSSTTTPTRTATPTATPDGGPDQPSGRLVVENVNADAEGNDHENLNDEYVEFRNDGDTELELTGWTLADEADHQYDFPSEFTLGAGDTVTVYTGSGDDTENELYWGSGRAVWNNGGDTVYVTNDDGETVVKYEYRG